jgi:hypothetical protein
MSLNYKGRHPDVRCRTAKVNVRYCAVKTQHEHVYIYIQRSIYH